MVVEGEDDFRRPYVSQLVFSERDGRIMLEREPGFWLGVVSSNSQGKFTGAASWTTMHDASEQAGAPRAERLDALMQQARTPCTTG